MFSLLAFVGYALTEELHSTIACIVQPFASGIRLRRGVGKQMYGCGKQVCQLVVHLIATVTYRGELREGDALCFEVGTIARLMHNVVACATHHDWLQCPPPNLVH